MKEEVMVAMEQKAKAVEELVRQMGVDASVTYKKVWKNNTELDALVICQEGRSVTPTVYFSDESVEQLAQKVKDALALEVPVVDINSIFTRAYFNEHLRPRLIADNQMNREGLKRSGIDYIPYGELGLLITCEVTLDVFEDGAASIQLTREHMDKVGMSRLEVFERAKMNISKEMEVLSMREMLRKTIDLPEEIADEMLPMTDDTMYILTNKDRRYGAACLLSDKAIRLIEETIGTDEFYVLPSSVHEVIILRKSDVMGSEELLDMVKSVNAEQVSPEEQLADAVFAVFEGQIQKVA